MSRAAWRAAALLLPGCRMKTGLSEFSDTTGSGSHQRGLFATGRSPTKAPRRQGLGASTELSLAPVPIDRSACRQGWFLPIWLQRDAKGSAVADEGDLGAGCRKTEIVDPIAVCLDPPVGTTIG